MKNFYEQLIEDLTKTAATVPEDQMKKGMYGLDDEELVTLASTVAEMTGDTDLAEMAKILNVYGSKQVDGDIAVQNVIQNSAPAVEDNVSTSVVSESEVEQLAAEEDEEEDEDKEVPAFIKEKQDEKDDKEDEEDEEDDEEESKSAAETLYEILKEGAALEELIEVRAAQMVESMIKEAEDAVQAREIVDAGAAALSADPIKAYDYAEQLMDRAKTVAAQNDANIVDAAAAVVADVVGKAPAAEKVASTPSLELLSKQAAAIEAEYEKLAGQIDELAEQLLAAEGMKQGLTDVKLHDFVMRGIENVRTLAAKKDINIAQAAQEYISGVTGSVTGVEVIEPSPSVAPSQGVASVINSNVTPSPDMAIPQMVAAIDPAPEPSMNYNSEQPVEAATEVQKQAAAMLVELLKVAGVNLK